jgi:cell division protein FtsI (penicillin-binding protein 3)
VRGGWGIRGDHPCALVRLAQVQYIDHDEYAALAEKQHIAPRELQASRGGIFDRNGRPLAMNLRRCSIAVQPKRIKNAKPIIQALSREAGVPAAVVRAALRGSRSYVYVKHDCVLADETRQELSHIDGIVVETKANRIYPYDAVASKVVGFVSRENRGLSGIELAYDGALRGTSGRVTVLRNGRYSSDRYYEYVDKKPRDGRQVFLTIDATVQDIAETELRRAVDEFGGKGGAVIIMEVATGDVLALAEYPAIPTRDRSSHADSLWTLRSVSHIYEPGSTFKLVTVAALLDKTHIAPVDSFNAEDGKADLGFATIRDPHPHQMLTVEEAFMFSSNIVMAKASAYLQNGDLYGYAKLFGFGARTGIGLPGESAGSVPPINRWSARTRATMAFGQEVAVTPVQVLNAYAAIANDGVMMMPRLVKSVVDPRTGERLQSEPVVVRRVVSPETARTLREFCLQVVENGTAQAAKVSFMKIAGKTGTAQKAGRRGYLANRYVSSFVGFAPYEAPRIACLVMIDEPKWSSRFGGDSAAPAFGRICESLASSTPIFDDVLSVDVVRATNDENSGSRLAPNFLRMEREAALETARRGDTNVICEGTNGRVVAQTPVPGTPMHRSDVIQLVVSGDIRESRRSLLDVQGNQRLREAYRQVPGDDDAPGDRSPDAIRVGTNTTRAGSLMAMAGVRGRKER